MKKLLLLALLSSSSVFAQTPKVEQVGAWFYSKSIDLFTDEDTSFIAIPPLDKPSGSRAGLSIKCNTDGFKGYSIIILVDGYLGSDDEVAVQVRFDKAPVKTAMWFNSVAGTGVLVSDVEKDDVFANMKKSKTMVFRALKYDKSTVTYQFDLTGIAKALTKLKCIK